MARIRESNCDYCGHWHTGGNIEELPNLTMICTDCKDAAKHREDADDTHITGMELATGNAGKRVHCKNPCCDFIGCEDGSICKHRDFPDGMAIEERRDWIERERENHAEHEVETSQNADQCIACGIHIREGKGVCSDCFTDGYCQATGIHGSQCVCYLCDSVKRLSQRQSHQQESRQ